MKKKVLTALLCTTMLGSMLMGCGGDNSGSEGSKPDASSAAESVGKENTDDEDKTDDSGVITVGFSQVGAESDWRTANSESMKDTFSEANGYELIFDDAQQKQENQITAIRNFIQQEVDYILLAPVTETGWDTVLQEAKDADIPVIIVDRMVNVSDDSLFTTWIGTDSLLEGRKASEWLNAYAEANGIAANELNIVNIQGTIGSTAQIGRSKGLEEGVEKYGWNLLEQQTGEFTQAKGQEVMESMLKQHDNINVVYCENDNEAFGAIDAIEAAGKKVGGDVKNGEIMVISFDTTNAGLTDTLAGKITCDVECNPLHGPRAEELIKKLEAGETVEKLNYVDEEVFTYDDSVKSVTAKNSLDEEADYAVTQITQEILDKRAY
ncbi:ABC transporter substrate-binding protein [Novisyntrophococcus fermenticellae]|uniref:ABC transporter substrate-binding protein n=1 Tax=Novisyntrophococcus fermenticellae TaxID=2068655 RepID=UPI001E32425E|nr:ABC transporter substrate-binding protein [Novisyntrophococcus fermenticellae]